MEAIIAVWRRYLRDCEGAGESVGGGAVVPTERKISSLSTDASPSRDDYLVSVDNATGTNKKVALASAVALVEDRALAPDLGQVVEVVGGRRRGGRPFERVRLPGIVARDLAVPERDEDVSEVRQIGRAHV